MSRTPVTSSFIKEVGWEDQILEIEFANGTVYQYFDVPEDAYKSLVNSASIGSEFHRSIKPQYRTEKVN